MFGGRGDRGGCTASDDDATGRLTQKAPSARIARIFLIRSITYSISAPHLTAPPHLHLPSIQHRRAQISSTF